MGRTVQLITGAAPASANKFATGQRSSGRILRRSIRLGAASVSISMSIWALVKRITLSFPLALGVRVVVAEHFVRMVPCLSLIASATLTVCIV